MAKPKYKKVIQEEIKIEPSISNDYPEILVFLSDGSEAEYVEAKKIDGKVIVYYRYTKSKEKLNMILPILDIHLKGVVDSVFCEPAKLK